jgi:hypothetical protein
MPRQLIVFLLFAYSYVSAQEKTQKEVYAAMVYNIVKYVQWPNEGQLTEFTIGVLGDDQVYDLMSKVYGSKTKGAAKIVIKKLAGTEDMASCQAVFISESKSSAVASVTKDKPILIISNGKDLTKKGGHVNFIVVDGKLRFELNPANLETAGLKSSSALSSIAIIVK